MDEHSNPIVMEEIKGEVPHSRVRVRMRVKWRRKRGYNGLGIDKRPKYPYPLALRTQKARLGPCCVAIHESSLQAAQLSRRAMWPTCRYTTATQTSANYPPSLLATRSDGEANKWNSLVNSPKTRVKYELKRPSITIRLIISSISCPNMDID